MVQVAGVFLLFFGVLGKFGALFVTIPDPVMGGVFLVVFGKPVLGPTLYCLILGTLLFAARM